MTYPLELAQRLAGTLQVCILFRKTEPQHVLSATLSEECGPCDGSHAGRSEQRPGPSRGVLALDTAGIREYVVRTGRNRGRQPCVRKRATEPVPLLLVVDRQPGIKRIRKLIQPGYRGVLEWRRAADIGQVVKVGDRRQPLTIGSQIADAPTSNAEGLGIAGDGDRTLSHSGQRGRADMACAIEQKIFVDLIGEEEEIMLNREFSNGLEFRAA